MPWSIFSQGGGSLAAKGWAEELLKEIGAPVSPGNLQFVYDWEQSEGGGGRYNPLNEGPVPGQPGLTSTGPQYGGGAADFVSPAAGLQGARDYLNMPNFSAVRDALRADNPVAARQALWASPWASSHYGYGANWSNVAVPGGRAVLPAAGGGAAPAGKGGGGGAGGGGSPGLLQDVGNVFGWPVRFLEGAGSTVGDIGTGIAGISNTLSDLEAALAWLFVPNHWIRIFAGIGGTWLVFMGLVMMSRVGRPYSIDVPGAGAVPYPGGEMAAAIAVGEVTFGAALLFIAFHNLPDNVATFPQFLSHIQQQVTSGASKNG